MKSIVKFLAATWTVALPMLGAQAHAGGSADSVVKVFSQMRLPNPVRPWIKQNAVEVMGSGVVIEGNRILTNAHLVLYADEIFVQGGQGGDRVEAKVVAIGPGISREPQTSELVRSLVAKVRAPTVVDADGLNAFEGRANELNGNGRTLVITPHPGEMARLSGLSIADVQKDRLAVARKFAHDHEVIVVLKGHRTLVVRPDGEAWVNTTGNPGMATGGTGDILTGMVAGMIAQHPEDVFAAVLAAVHLHGLAGDVMRERVGEHSLVATDLLRGLPEAFRRTQSAAKNKLVCW